MADDTLSIQKGTVGATGMRYHELALQRWFYSTIFVRSGYAVPVVFGTPMDAFGNFTQLWKSDNNPFKYLLALKDDNGTPLYEPYPSTVRYPLISVFRKGWKLRPEQSYGVHQWRHMNWPTVSANVERKDLGNVSVSYRPMGWDFRFQIDHYAMRPDVQASFIEQIMRNFAVGGGTSQTWMTVHYPASGLQRVRMYIDGDIENSSKEEPEDQKHVEFRTTFQLVVEGYSVDQNIKIAPALWKLMVRGAPESASPSELNAAFHEEQDVDLRLQDDNVTMKARPFIPPEGNSQQTLANHGTYAGHDVYLSGTAQPAALATFGQSSTNTSSPYFTGGIAQTSGYGIVSVGSV